ncbi:MAG: DUF4325 domain-containing protein [Candidatus Saccharibacteria bacterium]|nr:DUF4325 domain-containing protein [Candidatus Saccharibacteria bacterium]
MRLYEISRGKKQAVIRYIIEKITQHDPHVTKTVSEVMDINQNTVHSYITELIEQEVVQRTKRGQYELVHQKYEFCLERSKGDLDSDFYTYENYLEKFFENDSQNVREIWAYAFSEMINNVMDHSLASEAHIRVDRDSVSTSVIISDNGVGIFRKLQEHFGFKSPDEAICELFKGKLTTDSANHSGEGIFFSSRMMDDFFILSDGKVFCINKYEESILANMKEFSAPGTCVYMRLSNTSNKKASEIFDRYTDVDSGFTKTSIPLKNIFDSSPVSRSQAKRLCNRMDCFEKVTLDFDGLDWMGQGFAHQLFIVFAREHPEIRLLPVNMNAAVEKMYNHVLASK